MKLCRVHIKKHCTETALFKVQNDFLMAIGTYGGAVVILLDLSAAIDTINHTILLQWLHEFGIRDAALDWFKSYFSQRRQSVVINATRSSHRNLSFRVPQGSVLGPILFTLYTPLGAITRKYQLNLHLYADDEQQYMAFKPNNAESLPLVISNIQNCVIYIKSGMTANMLQLNMDKTEVLVLMNESLRNPITMNKIKIDSINISTANSVRNLGAIFDSALSSEAFVNSICKSAWFNLFNINRSRRSLTTDATKILIQAYVMSKIDIATTCCTASQINYWIVFSEFRTMLLGWSSGCIDSAVSHQHWPHYTASLSIAGSISRSHCWFTKP